MSHIHRGHIRIENAFDLYVGGIKGAMDIAPAQGNKVSGLEPVFDCHVAPD